MVISRHIETLHQLTWPAGGITKYICIYMLNFNLESCFVLTINCAFLTKILYSCSAKKI